jgi:lipopolysaccharide transport protein LptA
VPSLRFHKSPQSGIAVSIKHTTLDRHPEPGKKWSRARAVLLKALFFGTVASVALTPALALAEDTAASRSSSSGAVTTVNGTRVKTAAATSDSGSGKKSDNQPEMPFGDFSNSNRGPVNIVSDSLNLDYKNNKVLFFGHVHATQADARLISNTLDVQYGKDFHEIQDAVAEGDVQMSQGLRSCTAQRGVLNQAAHTLVLTGSPVCHDDRDAISGPKITVHLDSGRSEVAGGVRATFFPRQNKTGDNGVSAANHTNAAADPVK